MTKVTIDRELLERIDETAICDGTDATISDDLFTQLVAALAAPRQPEGDAISRERVQSEADAFFDWPTADKSSVTTTSCLIFARCIAGMVAAERDATIAELRAELADARAALAMHDRIERDTHDRCVVMREECEHLKACQENDMLHMTGLVAERDNLRQQLAERDAQIASMRAEVTPFIETHWMPVARQRDKLAGLLADVKADYTHAIHWEDLHSTMKRIDAALAEVNK